MWRRWGGRVGPRETLAALEADGFDDIVAALDDGS